MTAQTLLLTARRGAPFVLARVVVPCATLVPVLVALVHVHQWGRDVPFWDEWERSAHLAVRTADGSLSVDDVLRAHNEHRLLFSALVTVASVRLAGWSLVGEMYVSVALSLVAFLLLLSLVRGQADDRRMVLLLAVPLAMLVFWPAQWFNWLVGFQTQVYGFMAFSIAAIRVVSGRTRGWGALLAAGALANGAQFSQAGGIAIWPAVLPGLWMLGYRRRQLAAWVAMATASLGVFFHGYVVGDASRADAGAFGGFALAYLGGPFVGPFDDRLVTAAIATAVAGLAAFAWILATVLRQEGGRSRAAPWTMLVLLGLGTAVLVARNRAHLGLSYALVSRYATPASLLWLGLCGLCGQVIEGRVRGLSGGRVAVAASALTLALVVALYPPTRARASSHGLVSDDHVACLRQLPETGRFDCLAGTHPAFDADFPDAAHRQRILALADGLASHGLGVFSGIESRIALTARSGP